MAENCFLFFLCVCLCIWMSGCHIFFISSSINTQLNLLPILTIMKYTLINMGIPIFIQYAGLFSIFKDGCNIGTAGSFGSSSIF